MKKHLVNFFTLGVGVIFSLLICELIVRYFTLAPEVSRVELGRFQISDNPKIGIEPIPFSKEEMPKYKFSEGKIGLSDTLNQLGFRDRNPKKKIKGVNQVIVLGDSITMGNFIKNPKNIYTHKLKLFLDQMGVRSNVINFGVTGYNTVQEVETLRTKGLILKPDVVLLQYCLNDNGLVDSGRLIKMIESLKTDPDFNQIYILPYLNKSAFFRYIYFNFIEKDIDSIDKFYEPVVKPDLSKAFSELKKMSKQYNFKLLAFIFPTRNMGEKGEIFEHKKITNMLDKIKIKNFDLLDTFEECEKNLSKSIWHDLYHPNELGHSCAAKAISQVLVDEIQR